MKLKVSVLVASAFLTLATTFAVAVLPTQAAFASTPKAMLCRDCPFPMKIGDGIWIMPNEKLEVQIEKVRLPSRFEEVHVTLRDPDTHEVLAHGMSKQKRGRRTVNVQLFDNSGREVKGFVRFVDREEEAIQAKFTCDSCAIGSLLN